MEVLRETKQLFKLILPVFQTSRLSDFQTFRPGLAVHDNFIRRRGANGDPKGIQSDGIVPVIVG
jgi:hypothetical protein